LSSEQRAVETPVLLDSFVPSFHLLELTLVDISILDRTIIMPSKGSAFTAARVKALAQEDPDVSLNNLRIN